MAKLGVIRFEMSAANDVSRVDGSSAVANVRDVEMVGSDSSSATNGSSVAIVAGKNRFPANPWANALAGTAAHAKADARLIQPQRVMDFFIGILPWPAGAALAVTRVWSVARSARPLKPARSTYLLTARLPLGARDSKACDRSQVRRIKR